MSFEQAYHKQTAQNCCRTKVKHLNFVQRPSFYLGDSLLLKLALGHK